MVRDRSPGWINAALAVAVALSLGIFALTGFLPQHWVVYNGKAWPDTNIDSVTLLQPTFQRLLSLVGLLCLVALLALAVIGLYRRNVAMPLIALLAAFLCPVAGLTHFVRNLVPWQIHSELRADDGTIYYFAESSFLQGQTLMLARLREETLFTRTMDALVVTNGDNPRSYLRIIRPAEAEDKYGQLYLTEDHWLLGLRTENRCFFAYDLGAGKPYGHGAVEELSPFLAIGNQTLLHKPDVASLLAVGIEGERGAPTRAAVKQSLAHPNKEVRAVALQLLGDKPLRIFENEAADPAR